MAAKQLSGVLRTYIAAGKATPSPPLGPSLGQGDRTFTFEMNSPPVSHFLKTAAGIEKGAQKPGREVAGTVTLKQIYEIAKIKKQDSNNRNVPLKSVCRSVIGSARSMGIQVIPGKDSDT
ncbi:ribosomal large subunit assembly [Porites harrisoni]